MIAPSRGKLSNMAQEPFDPATFRVIQRSRAFFYERGYSRATMGDLADACRLTRRGLYHHFRSKEELFRAGVRLSNEMNVGAGDRAARAALTVGGSAVDVLAAWLDARFGETRREVARSRHGEELNTLVFRLCHDLLVDLGKETNERLATLIRELCGLGLLRLRNGITAGEMATLIGDGARGVNQARPPVPNGKIAARYRLVTEAILYGTAERD